MTAIDPLMPAAEVMATIGIGRTALYDWVARGLFPAPLRLSAQCVRWRASEVQAWIDTRPRTRDADAA